VAHIWPDHRRACHLLTLTLLWHYDQQELFLWSTQQIQCIGLSTPLSARCDSLSNTKFIHQHSSAWTRTINLGLSTKQRSYKVWHQPHMARWKLQWWQKFCLNWTLSPNPSQYFPTIHQYIITFIKAQCRLSGCIHSYNQHKTCFWEIRYWTLINPAFSWWNLP
jgi:hypothetical protein